MMQMVLAAAQADPAHYPSLMNPRHTLPPPNLSRRKRACCDDDTCPGRQEGWVEERDANTKFLYRYDPRGDICADECPPMELTGRRVERKDRKNKREQERRKEINDRFAVLSDLLFGSKFSGRVDKTQILDRAIDIARNGPSFPRNESAGFLNENAGDSKGHMHGARWRPGGPQPPHCHSEMEPREMDHPKYANTFPQSYPNMPPNGSGFAPTFPPPYFQQYPPHSNIPLNHSPEPPRFVACNRRGGRCFECESDGSVSPERRSSHCIPGSSGMRTNAKNSALSNYHGNCASRKEFHHHPNNDDDESEDDVVPELVTQSDDSHEDKYGSPRNNIPENHFSATHHEYIHSENFPSYSNMPPEARTKAGFASGTKCDANMGMQVALLDTLVQLSQNPKRAKK